MLPVGLGNAVEVSEGQGLDLPLLPWHSPGFPCSGGRAVGLTLGRGAPRDGRDDDPGYPGIPLAPPVAPATGGRAAVTVIAGDPGTSATPLMAGPPDAPPPGHPVSRTFPVSSGPVPPGTTYGI
jgi:hypothetical protein